MDASNGLVDQVELALLGGPLPSLPDDITETEALKLQLAAKHRLAHAGDAIAGHLASISTSAAQRAFPAAPHPLVGTLLTSMQIVDGGKAPPAGPLMVEAEIAVRLARDLEGATVQASDVLTAIDGFLPAIELVAVSPDAAGARPDWMRLVALQKCGGFFAIGREVVAPDKVDMPSVTFELALDGIETTRGEARNLVGGPLSVVAALVRKLARAGEGLWAGQIVLTGSLASPILLPQATGSVQVRFSGLGDVRVEF